MRFTRVTLYATTILVPCVPLLMSSAIAQSKVAPITVVVGGYHEQTVGYARNKNGITYAAPLATPGKANRISQMSDSEIFFGGRTTLANGITIGFDVQLEANSQAGAFGATFIDTIDESYIFVDGAFGRLVLGSENDAPYIMHVSIPAAGRAYGALESAATNWIVRPTNFTIADTLQSGKPPVGGSTIVPGGNGNIQFGNDQQRITYYTPRFFGLQGGFSYTPNNLEDTNGFQDRRAQRTNGISGGLNYTNTFSGVAVTASAGIAYWPKLSGATTKPGNKNYVDLSAGAQLGYMGFAVGGGYRVIKLDGDPVEGHAWGIGMSYTTGPLAIGLSYLTSSLEGSTAIAANDKYHQVLLSSAYSIGPGVDLIGAAFYIKYNEESGSATDNSGVGVTGGLRLTF